ncbi:MAG: HEAT repeat domain-containing protein [Actinobacteria bacterium]|nr:HEAT repeat domain-containing protein [Actinomycetota bacterium]
MTNASGRRDAAISGHTGDEKTARTLLHDAAAATRATALAALARMGRLTPNDLSAGLGDHDPIVRRRACELAATADAQDVGGLLVARLADSDDAVVEMAAWALGERGDGSDAVVAALSAVAGDHRDALCREAAVAALGAIGAPGGLPAILAATTDKPAVRRRAVIALAPFDGPEVDAALQRALEDRDWQVRQAAEDLLSP